MVEKGIVEFIQDDEGHWVALLECGHKQHVRHDPPWQNRPWVISVQGRQQHIGRRLTCKACGDRESSV